MCADVIVVPVLSDNFAYLLIDSKSKKAACVDPVEPTKVLEAVSRNNVTLEMSLTTHKHFDHAGGNEKLADIMGPNFPIVGSGYEHCPGATRTMKSGDTVSLGSLVIEALHTPCHTAGHLLYYVRPSESSASFDPILFTGDTIFVGGCGRFFEGKGKHMLKAMNEVKSRFPRETRIFCGHEYTIKNLVFAASVDPHNEILAAKLSWAKEQIRNDVPTVPSTVGEEIECNPFMRTSMPAIKEAAERSAKQSLASEDAVMSEIRKMKDSFYE